MIQAYTQGYGHAAELEALVERDDTAARLPGTSATTKEGGIDKCPISSNVEAGVAADESPEIR